MKNIHRTRSSPWHCSQTHQTELVCSDVKCVLRKPGNTILQLFRREHVALHSLTTHCSHHNSDYMTQVHTDLGGVTGSRCFSDLGKEGIKVSSLPLQPLPKPGSRPSRACPGPGTAQRCNTGEEAFLDSIPCELMQVAHRCLRMISPTTNVNTEEL